MNAKHVALLALMSLGGSALVAQPPDAPPPDQYQAPDSYAAQPGDSYAAQPAAYDPQPPDQYAPDQGGQVDETYFYNQLSPYGHWVESRYHGWVWLPYGVRAGWRPYALGHWVMTDYGWTWVSDEPFGWATYHYGRWAYDPDYGWEWIPGYEWGPAWVAWRNGGGYIGWAPLPPEVRFRVGIGLDFGGVDLNVVLGPTHFCFVEERSFLRANVFSYVEPPARNVTIIHNTTNITNYTVVNNRVVNQGIPVQHVEQVTGQRVQRLQVATVKSGPAPRSAQVRGNQLTVFQPPIVRRSASTPPPPPQQRIRASGADLERQHQQETQALQAQQAQERVRLQQIHQREVQSQGRGGLQGGANQRQRSAQEQQAPPERQRSAQEQQAPPERQRSAQEQQAPPERQRQATQQRGAAGGQELAQRHQAEVQAQQQQHQREQQQLE
ncbi:MAG TPA: DUF6600 domain-containing protein, partial [Thermoanaerobaculia bacterium]|nr:DUF6600 domain-containing protein [Thermoanaerobaculia bacterium]